MLMKAAIINQFGSPDVFEIEDVKKPVIKDDQLLIKVFTHSINPIDWKQRKGNHKFILGSPFPIVLGYDICGEVIETGNKTNTFKKGDVVFGVLDNKYGGALAEYAIGHEKCFTLKPTNILNEEAAAFPMVALTGLQALRDKAKLKEGQKILINGASGGVGHMAIQIAKNMKAKVVAVSGSNSKEFVEKYKPDKFIDYTKQDILSTNIKVDVFFDVVGNYTFPKCKHLLNPNGIYITTLPRPKILIHKFHQIFSKGKKVRTLLMKHSSSDLELLTKWISENRLKISIDKFFTLEEIADAHEYAQQGHTKGKNVITICK